MIAMGSKVVAAAVLLAAASAAHAQYSSIVPGRMGPNALPALPVEDAALPSRIATHLGGSFHLTGAAASDTAFAPRFHVLVPFRQIAALEVEGAPFEVWRISPETRAASGARRLSGVSSGDVSFGARFGLLEERGRRPALTLRLLTKSTTGKGLENLRFTDGPAYAVQTLAAKTVHRGEGAVRAVRVLAKLGFLAWSQDQGLQDDALDYGAAVDTVFRRGTELRVELRGYQGYQSYDKPMLASVRVLQPVARRAGLTLAVNRGLRSDAPEWELQAGLLLSLKNPFAAR
jgi:hypothetical protein